MSTSVEYTPVSTNDVQNGMSTTIPRRVPDTDASHDAYQTGGESVGPRSLFKISSTPSSLDWAMEDNDRATTHLEKLNADLGEATRGLEEIKKKHKDVTERLEVLINLGDGANTKRKKKLKELMHLYEAQLKMPQQRVDALEIQKRTIEDRIRDLQHRQHKDKHDTTLLRLKQRQAIANQVFPQMVEQELPSEFFRRCKLFFQSHAESYFLLLDRGDVTFLPTFTEKFRDALRTLDHVLEVDDIISRVYARYKERVFEKINVVPHQCTFLFALVDAIAYDYYRGPDNDCQLQIPYSLTARNCGKDARGTCS